MTDGIDYEYFYLRTKLMILREKIYYILTFNSFLKILFLNQVIIINST